MMEVKSAYLKNWDTYAEENNLKGAEAAAAVPAIESTEHQMFAFSLFLIM